MSHGSTVLLAEDDLNDQLLVQTALKKNAIAIELKMVDDGQQAVDYLLGSGKYANRSQYPMPALILLDLKMPKKTGLEVLDWIRSNNETKLIPVIVMSSSYLQSDINRAYTLGVNAYLVKPSAFDELAEMFQAATDLFVHRAAKPTTA